MFTQGAGCTVFGSAILLPACSRWRPSIWWNEWHIGSWRHCAGYSWTRHTLHAFGAFHGAPGGDAPLYFSSTPVISKWLHLSRSLSSVVLTIGPHYIFLIRWAHWPATPATPTLTYFNNSPFYNLHNCCFCCLHTGCLMPHSPSTLQDNMIPYNINLPVASMLLQNGSKRLAVADCWGCDRCAIGSETWIKVDFKETRYFLSWIPFYSHCVRTILL